MSSKVAEVFKWIGIGVLTAAASVGIGYGVYIIIQKSNPKIDQTDFEFNQTFQDLSGIYRENSKTSFDKQTPDQQNDSIAYDFYKNNSRSIQIITERNQAAGTEKAIMGTMWAYPRSFVTNADPNRVYFATNIHVVDQFLAIDNNQRIYYKGTNFGTRAIDSRGALCELHNVQLEHIAFKNGPNPFVKNVNIGSQVKTANVYSDYCVLSALRTNDAKNPDKWNPFGTSPMPNGQVGDDLPFASPQELNWIFDPTEDTDNRAADFIYISSYPGKDTAKLGFDYKSIKINVKDLTRAITPVIDSNNKIPTTTARNVFYQNSQIDGEDAYMHAGMQLKQYSYGSYANQMIIPGLNIGGGSSGSVFTGIVDGKLKILGIWWGAYQSVSQRGDKYWDGSADLFWTGDYHMSSHEGFKHIMQPGYNNTRTNPQSLYITSNNFQNWTTPVPSYQYPNNPYYGSLFNSVEIDSSNYNMSIETLRTKN